MSWGKKRGARHGRPKATVVRRAGTADVIVPHETAEQRDVIKWARLHSIRIPVLELLFAVPNGGDRDPRVAAQLKAEGVRKGVPDLLLPVRSGAWPGLAIEMKRRKVRGISSAPSPEQRWWLAQLADQGFATTIAYGAAAAISSIERYLAGEWVQEPPA